MASWLQSGLLFSLIIIAHMSSLLALELPYEVLDSIMELSDTDQDFTDLTRVNVSDDQGPTRPIYRLDLDPDYVAYYEIDMGTNYVVLSFSSKTGDFREVESGPDPRPTNVLIQQAQENGQLCGKFYRLSPLGLMICKNDNGTVVAASYNWTADVREIEDWRQLDQMVEGSLDGFKRQWQERAAQRRAKQDWATTDVINKGKETKKDETDEEALSPGSVVKVALGERFKSAEVHVTNLGTRMRSAWQKRLCKVLVGVCLADGSTKVNPNVIKQTPNHLLYLKLEVHANRTFVQNVLKSKEIGFVVEIDEGNNEVVKKHFAISLHSKRFRRGIGSGKGSIWREHDFPDYDQHKCCGNCWSGCSPVAWAQVFGYYDIRASKNPWPGFSPRLYGDSSKVAPLTMKDEVKPFVEDIRSRVQTFCSGGQGATYTSKMHYIAPWFRMRQGLKTWVVGYIERGKGRRITGASVHRGSRSWIKSKGVYFLKLGYPVVFSFSLSAQSGHAVVATKYKKISRPRRVCRSWKRRICTWQTPFYYEFFLHYGWGGYSNKWQQLSPFAAHVAYLTK